MSELSEVITAAVVAFGTVGTGIAFIWNKIERREDKAETRFVEIEAKLDQCERREDEGQERRARLLIVIELLWQELVRIAPDTPVLKRARRLLDNLKLPEGPEEPS